MYITDILNILHERIDRIFHGDLGVEKVSDEYGF